MITLNQQPVEKRDYRVDGSLEIVGEPWLTIQGEGPFAGRPAVFVRLAGCDLQCPGCDTDYTSDRRRWSEAELATRVINTLPCDVLVPHRKNLVVLTGGEPFRQNLEPLVSTLLWAKFEVQIETNGTMVPEGEFCFPFAAAHSVTIVCSPKTPTINPKMERWIEAYKYILDADYVDPRDGLPITTLGNSFGVARPYYGFRGEVYVQPAEPLDPVNKDWHEMEIHEAKESIYQRNVQAAVESCMKYGYRLSLQLHKIIGVK